MTSWLRSLRRAPSRYSCYSWLRATLLLITIAAAIGCNDEPASMSTAGSSGGGQGGAGQGGSAGTVAGAAGVSGGASGAGESGIGGNAGTQAGAGAGGSCQATIESVTPEGQAFDVVIAADTTVRIDHARRGLGAELETLVSSLAQDDPDMRLVNNQFTETAPSPSAVLTAERYLYIGNDTNVESLQLLIDHFDQYASFVRPEASLQLVVLADTDSTYQGGADAEERARFFRADMELALTTWANAHGTTLREFRVHALFSEGAEGDAPCTIVAECCDGQHSTDVACLTHLPFPYNAAMPTTMDDVCALEPTITATAKAAGPTYGELTQRTGGSTGSICQTDWQAAAQALLAQLRAGAAHTCVYDVPAAFGGAAFDASQLNVSESGASALLPSVQSTAQCADDDGYSVTDGATPRIELCPKTCERLGGHTLDFHFGCPRI